MHNHRKKIIIYVVAESFMELALSSGNIEYFKNSTYSSAITNIEHRSPLKFNYSRDQLLNIGHTVLNRKRLTRLNLLVYNRINQLNIARRKQRGKRGGKFKHKQT